jgi:hypothetical protein
MHSYLANQEIGTHKPGAKRLQLWAAMKLVHDIQRGKVNHGEDEIVCLSMDDGLLAFTTNKRQTLPIDLVVFKPE